MNKSIRVIVNSFFGFGKLLGVAAGGLVVCMPAAGQETEGADSGYFEEIVVTVQRRAQNIMDVPVAVSAMTGTQIEAAGIKDLIDLQQNVPGLLVGQSQTATTTNFNIRGIGSTSNNFGVESSVGLYVDGVYRSRQSSVINDLVDIDTVEVARGPQGTLFGKNTASGAVSMRTVRPSQERDGFVDLTVGDFGLVKVGAATNIPINDEWAFRGTLFSSQRDGYVDDSNFGTDVLNDKDRLGIRLQLAKNEPGDDFAARIIADYSEINEVCCVGLTRIDSLFYRGSLANPLTITNGSDAAVVALGGTVFTDFPYSPALLAGFAGLPGSIVTGSGFDGYTTALDFLPVSENQDTGLSVELEWNLSNDMTLKSISAYRAFDTFDFIDGDFSDVDVFTRTNVAEQSSFSQEFQLSGEFGSGSTFVAGVYYFGQNIDQLTDTSGGVFFDTFLDILNPSGPQLVAGIEALRAALVGSPLDGLVAPATRPFIPGTASMDVTTQDHQGWAAFGQVDFSLSDYITLTLGARYTDETKDIDATYTQTANGPRPDLAAVQAALIGASVGDFSGLLSGALVPVTQPNVAWGSYQFPPLAPRANVRESVSDDQTTGTVKLSVFPNDNMMVYASFATGFKAGGTNTDRIDPSFDQVFRAETSESVEIGVKGEFGPVQYVVTYYDTEFDDFQANSFTGTGFNLQNAGTLVIDGWEIELLWRPTDSTEVQAFYAINNGEFTSFEDGTAWDTWVVHTGLWAGQGDPGCSGPFDPSNIPNSCPRTGDPIPYNPEDRGFIAVTQNFNLSDSTSMFIRAEYTHISDQFTDGDLDPFSYQDDVELINVRLGLDFANAGSSLTFWGRNITDEHYYHGSFDHPISSDKMFSYPSEPATYGVTFNKSFD